MGKTHHDPYRAMYGRQKSQGQLLAGSNQAFGWFPITHVAKTAAGGSCSRLSAEASYLEGIYPRTTIVWKY